MTLANLLASHIDDYGTPVLAALLGIWTVCRARRQSHDTPWVDRLPLVLAGMGLGGVMIAWIKWIDLGYWPFFMFLLGDLWWKALPNLREIANRHLGTDQTAAVLRHAIGIRPE